jgi:hypothetical protein
MGKVDLLVAGGAEDVLPVVSPICPLPHQSIHPSSLLAFCCFFVFVEMGANTASGRLKVNLFLSEKRGGKSHFGIILVSAISKT